MGPETDALGRGGKSEGVGAMKLDWSKWSLEDLRRLVGNSPRRPLDYGTLPRWRLEAFLAEHLSEPEQLGRPEVMR
jgi:hypothetical protein